MTDERTGLSRRTVMKAAAVTGTGVMLGGPLARSAAATAGAAEPPIDPILVLTKFAQRLPIPPVLRARGARPELAVRMRVVQRRLHPQLPPTTLWTYDGAFPGPTIEVERNQPIRVSWENDLNGTMPVVAMSYQETDPGRAADPRTNYPGRDGIPPDEMVAMLPPWTAVHLHGGFNGGGTDGRMEDVIAPGRTQLTPFVNPQRATALWYHDHAMHLTRWTMMAGLVGMYLIRDPEERALRLPSGEYEIPLVLTDRNLDTDAGGALTGQVLHKIELVSPKKVARPFAGPYSLVNGVIWPYLTVEPRWYRFRVLNACNGRAYRLMVLDDAGKVVPGMLTVIGTDQGLFDKPVPADADGAITLSPAERVDVLVNFKAFAGRTLKLINTRPEVAPGQQDKENDLLEPDIMQFRVASAGGTDRFALPGKLAASFTRLTAADVPAGATTRWIVLTTPTAPKDPELWEMVEVDPATVTVADQGTDGIIQLIDKSGRAITLKRVAYREYDGTTIVIPKGDMEVWRFLNISGPPHPMHIHMCRFQVLGRQYFRVDGWNRPTRGTRKDQPLYYTSDATVEPHENGWKDVVRVAGHIVSPPMGEMVTVAAEFDTVGASVYHCHALEHEPHMIRPFVVLPTEIMHIMDEGHG